MVELFDDGIDEDGQASVSVLKWWRGGGGSNRHSADLTAVSEQKEGALTATGDWIRRGCRKLWLDQKKRWVEWMLCWENPPDWFFAKLHYNPTTYISMYVCWCPLTRTHTCPLHAELLNEQVSQETFCLHVKAGRNPSPVLWLKMWHFPCLGDLAPAWTQQTTQVTDTIQQSHSFGGFKKCRTSNLQFSATLAGGANSPPMM